MHLVYLAQHVPFLPWSAPTIIIQRYIRRSIQSHRTTSLNPKATKTQRVRRLSSMLSIPRDSNIPSYVHHLEKRIANLERVLRVVCAITSYIHTTILTLQQYSSCGGAEDSLSLIYGRTFTNSLVPGERHGLGPLPASAYSKPEDMDPLSLPAGDTSDNDDEFFSEKNLGTITQEPDGEPTSCFYGKSSLLAFTNKAFDERGGVSPTNMNRSHAYRKEFWITPYVIPSNLDFGCRSSDLQWLTPMLAPKPVLFEFPAVDLLQRLVDCYFDNINTIFPILHRPSFVRSIQERLYETNQGFGAVLLLVCAIGCGFTDDPRVVHVISPDSSCTAWKFFHQVDSAQKRHYLPHSLYEAQIYPVRSICSFKH